MPKTLCVAEKPSISKSITQILSGGRFDIRNSPNKFIKNYDFYYASSRANFTVTAVTGHLTERDFPDSHRKWYSCDPFILFDTQTVVKVNEDKKTIERNLQNEARNADTLMIWTDCDREGEHIGSEIANVCRRSNRNIVIKRARFSAIIAQQIHNAAQHPVNLDQRLVDAVDARIILDLKIGSAFTRMQSLSLKPQVPQLEDVKMLSYGPCQYPTLGFIVSRFKDIQNFRPETFWYIYLSLIRPSASQGNDQETKFTWRRGHLFDEDIALVLYEHVMQNPVARVEKVVKKETKKWKPYPLTTVELQKAGSRLLKLAPKKVLDIAESLYNQGFLSYPRTETDQFDPQFDFQSLIQKQTVDPAWGDFAQRLQQGGFNTPRKGKNNDKAHPPIHPTAHNATLAGDEKRVYEYITRRFLACCSEDAIGSQTTVDVVCGDEKFYATGLTVIARNYLEVFPYDKWDTNVLPDFAEGETFDPSVCELRDGQTTKPKLLTEADLVTLMDKNGIGTDATIAQHIQTVIDREYVIEHFEGATKYLVPSTLGLGLVEGYETVGFAKSFTKPMLRRETERQMNMISQGQLSKSDMIEQCIEEYKQMYVTARRELNKVSNCLRRIITEGINGPGEAGGNGGVGGGGGGGGGNGGGGGGGGGRGDNGGGGGTRGGRGGRGGGGNTGRGGGRGGGSGARGGRPAPSTGTDGDIIDISDDEFNPPPPPAKKPRSSKAKPASTSSSKAKPAPVGASSSKPRSTASAKPPSRAPVTDYGNQVLCNCGVPAVSDVIASESASHGRRYWKCGSGSCQFFKFIDQPGPSSVPVAQNTASSSSAAQPAPLPESDEAPSCQCNAPAGKRHVTKDSPNKGRPFWTCETKSCEFFAWADQPIPDTTTSSTVPTKRTFSNTTTDSSRKCACNEPATKRTSRKENENNGREFWCCSKNEGEGRCKFFEWDDEPGSSDKNRTKGGGSSQGTGQTSGECYKCQQPGHWASSCPNSGPASKKSRSFGSSGGNTEQTCYKCGQPGHWASACTSSGSGFSGKGSRGGSSRGRGRGGGRGRGRGKAARSTKTKSGLGVPSGFF